ncbi:MAG TPA: hypothetical protein VFF68_11010, partial [Anaerolineaceae bacterium]|nr:hypothetical protein [Anaerolineaceae bacterium]
RLPLAVEGMLACQAELNAILEKNAAPPPARAPERPAAAPVPPAPVSAPAAAAAPAPLAPAKKPEGESLPADVAEFEALFAGSGAVPRPEDADAFWEAAIDPPAAGPGDPDMITYDQARRLGLAPEEKKHP